MHTFLATRLEAEADPPLETPGEFTLRLPSLAQGAAAPPGAPLNNFYGVPYIGPYEPLLVIIGLGVALLLLDFAFGAMICKRPSKGTDDGAQPAKSSTPSASEASTPPTEASSLQDLQDRAAEWDYFKKTKSRVLLLSMVLGFASEFLLWMLAPFFPGEASVRGVPTEIIGLVFACHPIALGVSAQLAPWLMRNVDPFVILQRTLLLQAVFIAGFGLAGQCGSTLPFAASAMTNRFMLGLMSGINEPCSQAITLRLVPSHAVAYAFGLIIAARFSAMVIGPAVGGALYELGGFPMPFIAAGVLFLLLGALTMWVGRSTNGASPPPPPHAPTHATRPRAHALLASARATRTRTRASLTPRAPRRASGGRAQSACCRTRRRSRCGGCCGCVAW